MNLFYLDRDNAVKNYCVTHRIKVSECIEQSLWDPLEIIEANGGTPPLTYSHFCHVIKTVGLPRRPLPDADLRGVTFLDLTSCPYMLNVLTIFPALPTPQMLGIERETGENKIYQGGERLALKFLERRIAHERESFLRDSFLPNKFEPDILNNPKSLSPNLKFGCLREGSIQFFFYG